MTILRFFVVIAMLGVMLAYAAGLLIVAIGGLLLHRKRLSDVAHAAHRGALGVLLTCAMLWPIMLRRAARGERDV